MPEKGKGGWCWGSGDYEGGLQLGIGMSFGGGMPFHTNKFRLGKRHWNLETSSAVVEFPYPLKIKTSAKNFYFIS